MSFSSSSFLKRKRELLDFEKNKMSWNDNDKDPSVEHVEMYSLPDELIETILFFVNPEEMVVLKPVLISKQWKSIFESEHFEKMYIYNVFEMNDEKKEDLDRILENVQACPRLLDMNFPSTFKEIFRKLLKCVAKYPLDYHTTMLKLLNKYKEKNDYKLLSKIIQCTRAEQDLKTKKLAPFTIKLNSETHPRVKCLNYHSKRLFVTRSETNEVQVQAYFHATTNFECTAFLDNGYPLDLEIFYEDCRREGAFKLAINSVPLFNFIWTEDSDDFNIRQDKVTLLKDNILDFKLEEPIDFEEDLDEIVLFNTLLFVWIKNGLVDPSLIIPDSIFDLPTLYAVTAARNFRQALK
ncbi:hypothetical protein C9374_009490 [Naegleria lovaniensis]|uniref:F-box domain-containing protein n=1 Tax=Naegleria lovaniensis TaxID=51637 RepID=A0AA88GXM9_NAELO|nr:uncharacterized protein C9374_009490 [Naegleria lovaniensis]KAG2392913.1 hypothetical protein C9374_009490 [Naegleria lovaniensis]